MFDRRRDHAARAPRGAAARAAEEDVERAYRDVPHYRAKIRRRRRQAGRPEIARRHRALSVHARRPTCATTIRSACSRCRANSCCGMHASSGTTGKPTVVGYTQADLDIWADLMARSLACAGARPGDIVHNAYGYGLFTGGLGAHYGAERLGCTVVPVSGGGTERQVHAAAAISAPTCCAHAVLRAQHRRGRREHGRRSAQAAAAGRPVRRRAVERRDAPRPRGAARHQGGRHLRPVGDHRAGRRLRMPCRAERPARLGGSFPVRGDRSRNAAAAADRARPASWSSPR